MSAQRDIAWIDELRRSGLEDACVEFKRDNDDPDMIGKLVSALSNAARIEGREIACVLWGVEDGTGAVVGTDFDPNAKKVGGQAFEFRLAQHLRPSPAFQFRTVDHPDGRIVLLEIPAATVAPVEYSGTAYVRVGNATPKLADFPERFQRLIANLRPYVWESASAMTFVEDDTVLALLDYPAYFRLTRQQLPAGKAGILERLEADRLIVRDVGGRWNISNLGAILFATDLDQFGEVLARKAVRFVAYQGRNRAATVSHRQDGRKGYACGFEGLVAYLSGIIPQVEQIGPALRQSTDLYPQIALRELIANALIHQDMTVTGAGPQIALFADRLEITNPGEPLVSTERMIDLPARSRNAMIGTLMRRMGLCEEQGSGLDKVLISVEGAHLAPPKLQAEQGSMQVILYGPRSFADMTPVERVRACYQHAVLKWLDGDRMRNASLCDRLGIDRRNAAQVSGVIRQALDEGRIKAADPDHPRAGYYPYWG
ncbi:MULTISPECIES: ATP-binding protein [unclassified Sphingomonas]|jgi:ATP-dependent DNA helicase RecG|uniref:ATP-binding protein n=1 Tax=unclassified Sphingomonas TaxID=196159 RepID=UPI0025D6E606|nr:MULTISPECIES: ATP-binding protein [unclassified Sphingomonas]